MSDASWKAFERRIANRFGGRRRGPVGDDGPDILTDNFSIQCKLRAALPAWIVGAVENARRGAGAGREPLAILKSKGGRDDQALVVMRLDDFLAWHVGKNV